MLLWGYLSSGWRNVTSDILPCDSLVSLFCTCCPDTEDPIEDCKVLDGRWKECRSLNAVGGQSPYRWPELRQEQKTTLQCKATEIGLSVIIAWLVNNLTSKVTWFINQINIKGILQENALRIHVFAFRIYFRIAVLKVWLRDSWFSKGSLGTLESLQDIFRGSVVSKLFSEQY